MVAAPFVLDPLQDGNFLQTQNSNRIQYDLSVLGEIGNESNPNNLRDMYDGFTNVMQKHGESMVKNLNRVVAYELTDVDKRIVLDMKNHQKGQVYMHNPNEPRQMADLTLRMDLRTFNDICDGAIGGIKGVMQGRITF
jgi:hypothetical protein